MNEGINICYTEQLKALKPILRKLKKKIKIGFAENEVREKFYNIIEGMLANSSIIL